jgi:predicted enzyme related to lactoylglutathione lyase
MNGSIFNLLVLRAEDIERLGAFYAALGFAFSRHSHGNGPMHLAGKAHGIVLEIYPQSDQTQSTRALRFGFAVPCLDTLVARLKGAGARVLKDPAESPWGRRAVVQDFAGHKVELVETGT